jgi:hypothetical protein
VHHPSKKLSESQPVRRCENVGDLLIRAEKIAPLANQGENNGERGEDH